MLGYMAIKRVHNAQLRIDYYTFLSKGFIIRRLEANYSRFLLNEFIVQRFCMKGFLIDVYR
jgi:hypothetical protein